MGDTGLGQPLHCDVVTFVFVQGSLGGAGERSVNSGMVLGNA